jgi:hypothetical protein
VFDHVAIAVSDLAARERCCRTEETVATLLDPVLDAPEQDELHRCVARLVAAARATGRR